jgi:hypothetical protein
MLGRKMDYSRIYFLLFHPRNIIVLILGGMFLISCRSTNGIDGYIKLIDGTTPGGIEVTAVTHANNNYPNIKTKLVSITNDKGFYKFLDLIPNQEYFICVSNQTFKSHYIFMLSPSHGVIHMLDTLSVCPYPVAEGEIFYYDSSKASPRIYESIYYDVIEHREIIPEPPTYYISGSELEVNEIPSNGILVVKNLQLVEKGFLHKFTEETFTENYRNSGIYGKQNRTIEEGWYCNIEKFYMKDDSVRNATVLDRIYMRYRMLPVFDIEEDQNSLQAYDISQLKHGYYIFIFKHQDKLKGIVVKK